MSLDQTLYFMFCLFCPLRVKSGQTIAGQNLSLSAIVRKRTFQWDTRGKRRNDPVEGFGVPLFAKPLFLRRWWGPLGTAIDPNKEFLILYPLHMTAAYIPPGFVSNEPALEFLRFRQLCIK
jgi:hypothetical protein